MSVVYPWPHWRKPLRLKLVVHVDQTPLPVQWISPHRIDVAHAVPDWEVIRLEMALHAPAELKDRHKLSDVQAHACVTSPASANRLPVALTQDPADENTWSGSLQVVRDEVSGVGHLQGFVTATFATVSARILGETDPASVVFDPGVGPKSHGPSPITTVWTSFRSPGSGGLPALASPRAIAYCDASGAEPVLYLNEDVAGLQPLLDGEGATGAVGRARDMLGAMIADDVVATLADASVGQIAAQVKDLEDDDPFPAPESAALRAVYAAIAKEAEFVHDEEELTKMIIEAQRADDRGEYLRLIAAIRAVGQSLASTKKLTEDFISLLGVVPDE